MKISRADWERYISRLGRVSAQAAKAMRAYMTATPDASAEQLIQYAYSLTTRYGEAAAALACEMYDAIAAAAGAAVPAAEPAEPASIQEVARTVRAVHEESPNLLPEVTQRIVKRTAADTTLLNAIRDGAEWAWIPHGETCAFCIMLASNGWQPATKAAMNGGHAEHIHANCDCEYAIRFTPDTEYAGYNPREYRDMYDEADEDGKNWEARVNVMRRQQYAEKKDEINAQKREAYAERKERLGETEQHG